MIANQLTTRMRLLKGDLSKPSDVMMPTCVGSEEFVQRPLSLPPGLPLPKMSGPLRPPPGFPVANMGRFLPLPKMSGTLRPPPGFPVANMGRFPAFIGGEIGDTITNLQASIVGCHRETVRRDIPLENCPSSNLHYHVRSIPHTRHEPKLPAPTVTVKKGYNFNYEIQIILF